MSLQGYGKIASGSLGKKIKGDIVLTVVTRALKSPCVFFLWSVIAAFAWHAVLGRKRGADYLLKYAGVLLPLFVFISSRKAILWDLLLMKTSFDVLVGTRSKVSKVDDNLYLGVVPISEDGDAMVLCKKIGINAVVSVLAPHEQAGTSLVGTPLQAVEWNHIGIESHDRLILEHCKDGDPFTLTLNDLHVASDFMDRHLSNNKKVLVHCRNGGGHGASLVLAYFIKYKRVGLTEAWGDLKKSRKRINFGLQSPQTALLSKFMATSREGSSARGSSAHYSVNKRDKSL